MELLILKIGAKSVVSCANHVILPIWPYQSPCLLSDLYFFENGMLHTHKNTWKCCTKGINMLFLPCRQAKRITFSCLQSFFSKCHFSCCSSRSRRLHHRSGASVARAGRSRAGSVFGGRSPVSDHDGEQADETLQRPLPHLHQQAGPHGCQPQPSPAADEVPHAHSKLYTCKPQCSWAVTQRAWWLCFYLTPQ